MTDSKSGKQRFLDRLRGQSSGQKAEHETKELLSAENFTATNICRRGFPYNATCLAFDPIQKLLAIGTKNGAVRILGKPGVDFYLKHEKTAAVIKLQFLINEGAFVSLCDNDCVHLWSIRQKRPEIVHSLEFQKEKLTTMHLPFQSKWLYVGTDKGNVHIVSIESFQISGYGIAWNKAIDLSQRTHPGRVVHLSDCPTDDNKLLIGFEQGNIVLWDLKLRVVEARFNCKQELQCIAWHFEGKQFMSGHSDGSLVTWTVRKPQEPLVIIYPYATVDSSTISKPQSLITQVNNDNEQTSRTKRAFRPINYVEWKQTKDGLDYIVFSGGGRIDNDGSDMFAPICLTIVKNKVPSVVEMEDKILTFTVLVNSPYCNDAQDPYAVCVLLHNDLVMVDLLSPKYPLYENPYPMEIHESSVTTCLYLIDCPSELTRALWLVGSKQKRQEYVDKTWPIKGGEPGSSSLSYSELLVTGHADGSLKFWDATTVALQVLYKMKTMKYFDIPELIVPTGVDLYAVQKVVLCQDSRQLLISCQGGYVMFFKFCRRDTSSTIATLTVPLPSATTSKPDSETMAPDLDTILMESNKKSGLKRQRSLGSLSSSTSLNKLDLLLNFVHPLKVRSGLQKLTSGYQPDLICFIPWHDSQTPTPVMSLTLNSAYGLFAYGTDKSVTIIDTVHRVCILNVVTQELYCASADTNNRFLRKNNSSDCEYLNSPGEKTSDTNQPKTPISPSMLLSDETLEKMFPMCQLRSPTTPLPIISHQQSMLDPISSWENEELPPELTKTTSDITAVRDRERKRTSSAALEHLKATRSPKVSQRLNKAPLVKRQGSAPNVLKVDLVSFDLPPIPPERKKRNAKKQLDSPISPPSNKLSSSPDLTFDKSSSPGTPRKHPDHINRKNSLLSSIFSKLDNKDNTADVVDNANDSENSSNRDRQQSKGSRDMAALFNMARKISSKKKKSKIERDNSNRNRSSSGSSQESLNVSGNVGATCMIFIDSYIKKTESSGPTLWVGTSQGIVGAVNLKLSMDIRNEKPASATAAGVNFRTKHGSVLCVGFLDHQGNLLLPPTDMYKELNKTVDVKDVPRFSDKLARNRVMMKNRICSLPTVTDALTDSAAAESVGKQWLIVCCEKQIEVYFLLSSNKLYVQKFETPVVRAEILTLDSGPFIVGYFSTGRTVVYSVPSLRVLLDTMFLPMDNVRLNQTIQFTHRGHGLYMCSPSEIQKFTLSTDVVAQLTDIAGELFQACNLPDPPKQGFFKGLLGSGKTVDREELFGAASGKASKSVATYIPSNKNLEQVQLQSGSTMNPVMAARMALDERGEKLSEVEERTAQMKESAVSMSGHAKELVDMFKNKKWYNL